MQPGSLHTYGFCWVDSEDTRQRNQSRRVQKEREEDVASVGDEGARRNTEHPGN